MKRYASVLLVIVSALAGAVASPQSPAVPSASKTFPEALLEGRPVFDLAIFFQGDLRGNFGPCG